MTDPVARGWDEAAAGYDSYFVPRFAPWVRAGVDVVCDTFVPEGPILVPCCGTFPEAELLVEHFPDREIVGIDLSNGMVGLANRRTAEWPNVRAVQGDASSLDPQWLGRSGLVLSIFGLQQMPDPEAVLRSWVTALRPGGWLSVVFWPEHTQAHGPFAVLSDVVEARFGTRDSSWENGIAAAVAQAGAVVEKDEQLSFPMSHGGAREFFDAFVDCGPMRALAVRRGLEFVDEIRQDFLSRAPVGTWHHEPRARHIVARRR